MTEEMRLRRAHIRPYTLIGFFTITPLWVIWLVLEFVPGILASAGTPFLRAVSRLEVPLSTSLAGCSNHPFRNCWPCC